MNIDIDSAISKSGINAEKNTWERRSNVMPNIVSNENFVSLKTDRLEVVITRFEESILEIILSFRFAPVWLVEKWLSERSFLSSKTERDTIVSWVDIGVIWVENSVTGEYLRPTELLFKLLNKPVAKYTDIPFNQLTHTISEQDVAFSIMTGRHSDPINRAFKGTFLPKFSSLGIKESENDFGTNIIREGEFRSLAIYQKSSIPEIEETEFIIKQSIAAGNKVTPELEDFKKFVIIKKYDNTGNIKKDYKFHIPDMIIPMLRTDGLANSISIEIELSDKRLNRYIETMEKYKDNNRFGSLVWLTHSGAISKNLKQAFKEVGGLGHTKMYIYEFNIPSPSLIYGLRK